MAASLLTDSLPIHFEMETEEIPVQNRPSNYRNLKVVVAIGAFLIALVCIIIVFMHSPHVPQTVNDAQDQPTRLCGRSLMRSMKDLLRSCNKIQDFKHSLILEACCKSGNGCTHSDMKKLFCT